MDPPTWICSPPPRPSDRERRAGDDSVVFQTTVDLFGKAAAERLLWEEPWLVVAGGRQFRQCRRRWPLAEIEEFRLETTVGSCFLQASVGGRCVDILREPGGIQESLRILVTWLNARLREGGGAFSARQTSAPEAAFPVGETPWP
jgi:hypothetical protein